MSSVLARAIPCPVCGARAGEVCKRQDGAPYRRNASCVSRTPVQPCGSFGGYQRHKKAGETPCDPCREANRRYMAEYRNRRPEVREADIAGLKARKRAARRLIAMHRAEFEALLAEERSA